MLTIAASLTAAYAAAEPVAEPAVLKIPLKRHATPKSVARANGLA